MAVLAKMAYLAKMAELALNRQNHQTVNKNTNEMAKGPFGKWRFWRKWQNWHLIAKMETKIFAKIASLQGATFGIQFKSLEAGDFSPVSPLHAFLDISGPSQKIVKWDSSQG